MHKRFTVRRFAGLAIAAVTFSAGCGAGNNASVVPPGPAANAPAPGPPAAVASPSSAPSAKPSGTPTASPPASPAPTASPTSVPTASPTSVPTATPLACAAPNAVVGGTYYIVTAFGNVPAGGGAFSSVSGAWLKETFTAAVPTPTPLPTITPTPGPIPTPPPTRPFYAYQGTYTIASASAPTTGCFTAFTTTDGTPIAGLPGSALASGTPVPPAALYSVAPAGSGSVTSLSVTLSPSSPNATGTIALDSGDAGTVTIQSVSTVQLPLAKLPRPR